MSNSIKARVIVVTNKAARNLVVSFPARKATVAITYSALGADVDSRTVRIDTARAFALQITHRGSAHVQALACRSCTNSSTVENKGSNDNSPGSHRGYDCSCFVLSTPFIIGSVLCLPPPHFRDLRVTSISPTVRPHHRTGELRPLTSIYSFIQTFALLLKCS
jgi:hypothetical protein